MGKEQNKNEPDQENVLSNPDLNGTVDFEQYIEDALDDADMKEEKVTLAAEEMEELTGEQTVEPQTDTAIKNTTREIMEIISQNELIEKAKRDRIDSILSRQEKVGEKRTEILERLEMELAVVNKKRELAKAALKKAKANKLDDQLIGLIKKELEQAREQRKQCKKLISEEKKTLKNIRHIIHLLETAR